MDFNFDCEKKLEITLPYQDKEAPGRDCILGRVQKLSSSSMLKALVIIFYNWPELCTF